MEDLDEAALQAHFQPDEDFEVEAEPEEGAFPAAELDAFPGEPEDGEVELDAGDGSEPLGGDGSAELPSRARSRSRTPPRDLSDQPSDEELFPPVTRSCRFCEKMKVCEFGRDENFCSRKCYDRSMKGCDALVWDNIEAKCWLHTEGLSKWSRQIAVNGYELLTQLTEGKMQKVGVPDYKAKETMKAVEELRQGLWAQVEPPRRELPLDTVAEIGLKGDWEQVIADEGCRSYAAVCRQAIDSDLAWQWFEALEKGIPWQDPTDTKYRSDGKAIPRRTIFCVAKGCNCTYKYSGVSVKPFTEPDWLAEIREKCVDIAGLDEQPNSCNINLYQDGNGAVGWHTDDEPLFEGEYNDICILSLSLGSSRTFQVKKKGAKVGRNEATDSFILSHGDLCTMEGRFQRHYLHAVLKEPEVQEPRINLTWRFITKHNQEDGCKLHGPGN
eukprot:Skav236650  [mRNA]  locus=scaffold691:219470:220792:- [translate_table: standard]